ncbi:MAG TPA: hypothetical protein VKE51_39355 [Vicinamibacterales bacterium]|nr:hypothetical protein [Vicinamibacterales bacterium]
MRALRSAIADRIAAARQPRAAARLAGALWLLWAVVVWNVVFDQVIVRAGREYIAAAGRASVAHSARPNMDAFMRPAVTRGLRIATASGGLVLFVGFAALRATRTAHR